jgi:flagellar hook protein FlgE
MAFTTALSGLNAASNNLATTGNNIANANTVGFKRSRSEFADVYASSIGGVSSTTPGAGVRVTNVAQLFNQGNLEFTENSLDVAISGEGFFTLAASPEDQNNLSYSRSGEFKLNKEGFIVNNQGKALLVYQANGTEVADGFSTGVTGPVQISAVQGLPSATDKIEMNINFDASEQPITFAFDKDNQNSYTTQTSATIYDSFGTSHTLTTYFVQKGVVAGDPTWEAYHHIDGNAVNLQGGAAFGELKFNSDGKLKIPADGTFDLADFTIIPATGASDLQINKLNYFGSTQVKEKFSVNELNQNGLPAGRLTGMDIDDEGVIFARFSNGGSNTLGKIALTRFANPNGLTKLGDTSWGQGANSGEPIPGEAGANNFGIIQSGALEGSNVDLAAQLVNLIVAQQSYQANAETITTENTIIQTILNI